MEQLLAEIQSQYEMVFVMWASPAEYVCQYVYGPELYG